MFMESSLVTETSIEVKTKMHFKGRVLRTSLAGALIDIGVSQPAVIHISQMAPVSEAEPIKRVEDVLQPGQEVDVWVRKLKGDHIELTMIKPLDLEWREIKKGMTVKGTVTRLEKFGAFVEIGAERPGLVHISEMAHGYVRQPGDMVKEGDEVEAEVLDVNRRKKQIKLSMKALQPEPVKEEEPARQAPTPAAQNKDRYANAPAAGAAPAAPRRKKPTRKPRQRAETGDLDIDIVEINQVEAEPTAMEIALRDAMERAKSRKQQQEDKNKRTKTVSREHEDILSRTLETKVRK
jgi:predicted RNA-binding protein with RPS1 domain